MRSLLVSIFIVGFGINLIAGPVRSYALNDIPRGRDYYYDWAIGEWTYRQVHSANLMVSYVKTSATEYQVWWAPDIGITEIPWGPGVFYNRRYQDPNTGYWWWEFDTSPRVLSQGMPGTLQVNDVLYDASAPFRTTGSLSFKYVMYYTFQQHPCDEDGDGTEEPVPTAGMLYLAFSNNGTDWASVKAFYDGNPVFPCHGAGVPIEAAGALYDGEKIHLVGIEGDFNHLLPRQNMNRTQTYVGYALPSDAAHLFLLASPEVSNGGMFHPRLPAAQANSHLPGGTSDRFDPYHYFMNMGIAFDAASGNIYLGRVYPYPFDRKSLGEWPYNDVVPCGTQYESCHPSPGTLPNRAQIYRKHIGTLANIGAITTGSWELVSDTGHQSGYWNGLPHPVSNPTGSCIATPLQSGQTNIAADEGNVSFLKDARGQLVIQNGAGTYFSGDSFKPQRSQEPYCIATSNGIVKVRTFIP